MLVIKGPVNKKDVQPIIVLEGIFRRTLVYNDNVMICHFMFNRGSKIPLHSHKAHQIGHVIHGKLKFITETSEFIVCEGDSYVFDSYEKHGAFCLEPTEVIEVFSPIREEYK